jgi:hypothetical protein
LALLFWKIAFMTNVEILEQLKGLPVAERLKIVESTVHQLREDMERTTARDAGEINAQLTRAAEALLRDYSADRDLAAITTLDGEAFHA